jgi:hypothetical protein
MSLPGLSETRFAGGGKPRKWHASFEQGASYIGFAVTVEVNQGVVGDTAKLIMHRLIARQIRRDSALVEKAKIAHTRQAGQFAGWPFVHEWDDLLSLSPDELTSKLISRDREMVRLHNSSPFYLCEGVDFRGYEFRMLIGVGSRRRLAR